jgi:hypothetical protein
MIACLQGRGQNDQIAAGPTERGDREPQGVAGSVVASHRLGALHLGLSIPAVSG